MDFYNGKNDDKFVVFGQGEGIYADYADIDKIDGKARTYVVRSIGYYKQHKFGLERTVKPLPFSKMSAYPYDETIEHYPDDQDHNAYQTRWNTRVKRVKVERK